MSNVTNILPDRILGKTRKLTDDEVWLLWARFNLLYEAFDTAQLGGSEVINAGSVVTNNDQIVYHTPPQPEIFALP
jgi:hypothetical protein